jgi:hypothetical protein
MPMPKDEIQQSTELTEVCDGGSSVEPRHSELAG